VTASQAPTIRVFIRDLEVKAQIGVHGYEQGNPQPVRINVELRVAAPADNDDKLAGVVDYETVSNKIRVIVAAGHINLAETLAQKILDACFADKRVKSARVRVEKLHALKGAQAAGVEIEREAGG
jgi:dihydroneopterin aldolase